MVNPAKSISTWLARNPNLYPFRGKYFSHGKYSQHYLDEGQGEAVVMVHGNPTWSFFFRDLVQALAPRHRVLVPDHVGCGLSDKPNESLYRYTLESRVNDLDSLLNSVAPEGKLTLVVHDWGGMIGCAWAVRNPGRVKKMVLFNTAGFSLPPGKKLPWSLKLCRSTWTGPMLVRGLNLFCRGAARRCSIRGLSKAVREGFLAPYSSWADRLAVLRFVQDIPLSAADPAFALVQETAQGLQVLKDIPKLFCWGKKDFVFDGDFLEEWRRLCPESHFQVFENAGHYLLEDAGEQIIPQVVNFLEVGE